MLQTIILAGFALSVLALLLVVVARLGRAVVEAHAAARSVQIAAMRTALIRAAVTGEPLGQQAQTWPLDLAAAALSQAAQRADPLMAERIAVTAEPLRLRAYLERRLRRGNRAERARAATALTWHPRASGALRRALMRDRCLENRYLIARVLSERGEPPPLSLVSRALGLGHVRPGPGARLALNDRKLVAEGALRRLQAHPGASGWLRRMCAEALRRRQARSSLGALGV